MPPLTPRQQRRKIRSQIANAAASVIPFHCIICFDEFNTTSRPPMILPCGHTYVCLPCTKRLKRCMECREPLFLQQQQFNDNTTNNGNNHHYNNHHGRPYLASSSSNGGPAPTTPTKSPLLNGAANKIPLPIPKNLVLIAMMEATERQYRDMHSTLAVVAEASDISFDPDQHTFGGGPDENDPLDVSAISLDPQKQQPPHRQQTPEEQLAALRNIEDQDRQENNTRTFTSAGVVCEEEEEDEENNFDAERLIAGLTSFVGPSGTYAVREDGLVVLPQDPRKTKAVETEEFKKSIRNSATAPTKEEDKDNNVTGMVQPRRSPTMLLHSAERLDSDASFGFTEEIKDELEPPSLARSTSAPPIQRLQPSQLCFHTDDDDHNNDDSASGLKPYPFQRAATSLAASATTRTKVPLKDPMPLMVQNVGEEHGLLPPPPPLTSTATNHSSSSPTLFQSVSKTPPRAREPYLLEYGQKVQVINFEDGVATLARNHGFILATNTQLVKVGRPMEESCRLEGVLEIVRNQREEIEANLAQNCRIEEEVKRKIQLLLAQEPNHPVITEAPASVLPPPPDTAWSIDQGDNDAADHQTSPIHPTTPLNALIQPTLYNAPTSEPINTRRNYSSALGGPSYGNGGHVEGRAAGVTNSHHDFPPCAPTIPDSPVSIDNADLDLTRSMETAQSTGEQVALTYGCGTNLSFLTSDFLRGGLGVSVGGNSSSKQGRTNTTNPHHEHGIFMHGLMSDSLDEHEPRMRASPARLNAASAAAAAARSENSKNSNNRSSSSRGGNYPPINNSYSFSGIGSNGSHYYQQPSSSSSGVNFRSGMSGHYGLSASGFAKKGFGRVVGNNGSGNNHSWDALHGNTATPQQQQRIMRMRGEHRGLMVGTSASFHQQQQHPQPRRARPKFA